MQYDYSLLPADHRKRTVRIAAFVALMIIVYLGTFLLGLTGVTDVVQWLLMLAVGGLVVYLMVEDYLDRRSVARFIGNSAKAECSEAEMRAAVPPCFAWLNDNPELIDVAVSDGFVFELASGADCMLFNFSYVLSRDGKHARRYTYGIASVQEAGVFPHLFLDGKQNGASYAYQANQRLSLEGDFDDYFNLYVPDGESTDALTIFTPDVMQTLVAGGRPYDIELFGSWVIAVASGTQYRRDKLSALFTFLSSFDAELNERPVMWNEVDLKAALTSKLLPRRLYDSKFVLWLVLGLAAAALLWVSV